jgi:hypothetical protein
MTWEPENGRPENGGPENGGPENGEERNYLNAGARKKRVSGVLKFYRLLW